MWGRGAEPISALAMERLSCAVLEYGQASSGFSGLGDLFDADLHRFSVVTAQTSIAIFRWPGFDGVLLGIT